MATPVGHGIVGYTVARALGVKSRPGLALSIGAATLPDVDLLMGYISRGDLMSLHHEVITHKPQFPLIVGAAAGTGAALASLMRGRRPRLSEMLKPAALATALVGMHIGMDLLPLPYDTMPSKTRKPFDVAVAQGWNAVIDMAIYGAIAVLALDRTGKRQAAEA